MNNKDQDPRKEIDMRQVGIFITIPFVLSVPPIVGWWLGSWLDKLLDTGPFLMYLLILLGIVAALKEFLRIVRRFGNDI